MLSRADCYKLLASKITDELVICSIAGEARDWGVVKERDGNLYQVYMSGTTQVALGLALALPHRRVIALDGDGSILMGLSVLPVIAQHNPSNLIVIILDNEAYEAAGKIPTFTAGPTDLAAVARGAGIRNVWLVRKLSEFQKAIDKAFQADGATFMVVKTQLGFLPGTWVAMDGTENKYRFIRYIERTENLQIIKPPKKKLGPEDEV